MIGDEAMRGDECLRCDAICVAQTVRCDAIRFCRFTVAMRCDAITLVARALTMRCDAIRNTGDDRFMPMRIQILRAMWLYIKNNVLVLKHDNVLVLTKGPSLGF